MPTQPPEPSDILCENCGYTLSGLPPTGNCPECGTAINQSTDPDLRKPPAWEDRNDKRPALVRYLATWCRVTFTPSKFYRSYTARDPLNRAAEFAHVQWVISAMLFGGTVYAYVDWILGGMRGAPSNLNQRPIWWAALTIGSWAIIIATTRLAAWLTALEARYRGLRMPKSAVLRALYYHAAHITLVALLAAATMNGYVYLLQYRLLLPNSPTNFLYVLCAEVILFATYLFVTYWAAMRNIMYANR